MDLTLGSEDVTPVPLPYCFVFYWCFKLRKKICYIQVYFVPGNLLVKSSRQQQYSIVHVLIWKRGLRKLLSEKTEQRRDQETDLMLRIREGW